MTETADTTRTLTSGAVMASGARIGIAFTGALTTIVIARLLGPGGAGAYFVAQSVIIVLSVATTLGVEHGIAYFVSSGAWDARSAFDAALRMAVLMGLVGAAAGVGLRLLVPSAFAGLPVWLVAVVVASLPTVLVWIYATFVALATDRYEAYVVLQLGRSVLSLALAIPGALLYDLKGAVIGTTAASLLVGAGSVVWARRRLPRPAGAEPANQLRRAVTFGVKGYAANALQLLNYRLDLFILAAVATGAAVGNYSVAIAVTSVLWLLPGALSDVLFPRVAHLHAREGASAEAQLELVERKSVRHATIVTLAGAAALALALALLVEPVYGHDFRPAINLGLILLPGAIAIGISSVLSSTIVGRGKPAYSLYTVAVTLPVTVGLYAWLIPWLHATGAALASSISYCLSFALTWWFYERVTGRRLGPLLVPTRSELEDLRSVPRAALAWARGLRR